MSINIEVYLGIVRALTRSQRVEVLKILVTSIMSKDTTYMLEL